MLLKAKFHYAS